MQTDNGLDNELRFVQQYSVVGTDAEDVVRRARAELFRASWERMVLLASTECERPEMLNAALEAFRNAGY